MSNEASSEAKELALIDKVEFRIASAQTDDKLEGLLKIYLTPLLLKLASEHASVRNKVIQVCQHVNTRIKAPSIKLPVVTLLEQFKKNNNKLIRHFDLIYIQQGIGRIPETERLDLLPVLIKGLSKDYDDSVEQTAILFNLFLRLLHHFKLPPRGGKEDLELRTHLNLDVENDSSWLATWIQRLFLFSASSATSTARPGLNQAQCHFLNMNDKPDIWSPAVPQGINLVETKVQAAKFLACGAFTDKERLIPAIVAAADVNTRLSDLGEDMLKRALTAESREDPAVIDELYKLYLGDAGDGILPATLALQTRLLTIFSTSKEATTRPSSIARILRDSLTLSNASTATSGAGLAITKARKQVFSFVSWTARMANAAELATIAPSLVSDFRDYITDQGWPIMQPESKSIHAEVELRVFAYETIGLLAKACPDQILHGSLDLLRWFFQSLGADVSSTDVSLSIEQAMSSILTAYAMSDKPQDPALMHLLSEYASLFVGDEDESGYNIQRNTRYMAVRFANRCLPFSNVNGRMIALLALGGGDAERREVIEEGRRGIDPYWYRMLNPQEIGAGKAADEHRYDMPKFEELVSTLLSGEKNPLGGSRAIGDAVVFCWTILLHQALDSISKSPVIDKDWQRNIEALLQNDEEARDGIRIYLAEKSTASTNAQALLQLSRAAFEDYVRSGTTPRPLSGRALLEMWQTGPVELLDDPKILTRAYSLKSTLFSNFESARLLSSRMFGLMISRKGFSTSENLSQVKALFETAATWENAVGSNVHRVHGSMLALAHGLSRSKVSGTYELLSAKEHDYYKFLSGMLKDSRDNELVSASLASFSQLCLFGLVTPSSIKEYYNPKDFVTKVVEIAKKGNETAIAMLGNFAMQCTEDDEGMPASQITDVLYKLSEVRQAEVQFAIGSALSCAAIGWRSRALIGAFDIAGSPPVSATRSHLLQDIVEKVLEDCKTTKPALRQASVIWLLCLVQYCGHEDELTSRLRQCQVAFKGFLSDKDSVNQEVASRGLTLVYEKGDRELKDDLVRDLVTSFTSNKSNLSGSVSEDTQLFEAGALPTTEGQSVTTYKDIISLATEVGDPSLVYRFMSLASNSSIWSSRSAFGRFGLSRILSDASVDGYLANNPKLYSSLFRYRFDPNTNVRSAMNEIWTSLVKDSTATIDQYFDNILQDLLKSILNKEWRTRQASCAAIADLLQGRPLAKYEQYLTDIWELTFKVCDDIKGSVRTAAKSLARVLTSILIRSLEAGEASASTANAMLKQVLPFLLGTSGLESAAKDVQIFSLTTLMDIVKKGSGKQLRPFIAGLVEKLLALLSSIEPEAVNYIYLNADKYGVSEQDIDDARLSSVKMSPMMEAIERCLDMLDESVMPELEASLTNAAKTVIGLPSRVGVCRVIVSLATRHRALFQPYAGNFLKLLRRLAMDRNATVSVSATTACGYLARLADDKEILALIEYAKKTYFESEDVRHRIIAGEFLHAIAKHATDRFASLASAGLPFAYFGLHDIEEEPRKLFKAAWEENAGGSRAVLLYLKEILGLSVGHFESHRWSIKHTAAFTIADTVKASPEIADDDATLIWPALEKAIGGKTWDGKEKVLEAFVLFWKTSKLARSNEEIRNAMEKIIIREAKRNNAAYRVHALEAIAEFIEIAAEAQDTSGTSDWWDVTEPIVEAVFNNYAEAADEDEKMDVDSKTQGGPSSKDLVPTMLADALRLSLASIPMPSKNFEAFKIGLQSINTLAKQAKNVPAVQARRNIFSAIYTEAFSRLMDRSHKSWSGDESMATNVAKELVSYSQETIFDEQLTESNEVTRLKATKAALTLAKIASRSKHLNLQEMLKKGIGEARLKERSQIVLAEWQKVEDQLA